MASHEGKREPGLVLAIAGAGGVSALARRLGLKQPSVSRWRRVPAERVIAVESASGVPRELVRPDLYRQPERFPVEPPRRANGHAAHGGPEP